VVEQVKAQNEISIATLNKIGLTKVNVIGSAKLIMTVLILNQLKKVMMLE